LFARELDDAYLETLLHAIDTADPRVVEEGYHGHTIVVYRGRFVALARALEEVGVQGLDEAVSEARGDMLLADSLAGAREKVVEKVLRDLRQGLAVAQAGQEQLKAGLGAQATQVSGVRDTLVGQQQELATRLVAGQEALSGMRKTRVFRLLSWLEQLLARLLGPAPRED
jgi:hypothetical protein